ncbi:PREDICTED: uncharacterized protein LOC104804894 [Tarenaya hassleriana]|uniref:uncharacterized protein LOC104804894 n=1 Tax=Tarenaya hassleriana TaxID=28532 RepID=UPI00053C8418|nr:PREDICTED: uncharacterized protein LOC104804894 [Tarenaya hassleriana]
MKNKLERERKNYPIDAKIANKVEMDDGLKCGLRSREETSGVKSRIRCSSYSDEGRFSCYTEPVVKDQNPGFEVRSILKPERKVYTLKNPDKLNMSKKHVRFSDQSDMLSPRKKTIELSFSSLELDVSSLSCEDHQPSADDQYLKRLINLSSFPPHLSLYERTKHAPVKLLHPSELGINPNDAKAADVYIPDTTPVSNSGWKSAGCHAEAAPHFRSFTFTLNEIANERNSFLCQPTLGDMHHYWSSCHRLPLEWMQESVAYRERQEEDAFMVFPLNLQGELVSVDGFCPRGYDRQLTSCLGTVSPKSLSAETELLSGNVFSNMKKHIATETAYAKNGLDLFSVRNQRYPKYFPARFGVDETFSEKANAISDINHREISQSVHPPGSSLGWKSRWNDLIENRKRKSMVDDMPFYNTPATMRLMGKDVTVGTSSSNMQISGAGKVRTNEGIIARNAPFTLPPSHGSLSGNHRWPWLTTRGNPENALRMPSDNMRNPSFHVESAKEDPVHCFRATTSLIPDQRFRMDTSYSVFDSDLSFQGSAWSQPNSFTINLRPPFPSVSPLRYSNVDIDLNYVDPCAE